MLTVENRAATNQQLWQPQRVKQKYSMTLHIQAPLSGDVAPQEVIIYQYLYFWFSF